MDAQTIYSLLKPHLDLMEENEKKSLSRLISGMANKKISARKHKMLSLTKAKEKIKNFRNREIERERM